jgi:hypothetical protein
MFQVMAWSAMAITACPQGSTHRGPTDLAPLLLCQERAQLPDAPHRTQEPVALRASGQRLVQERPDRRAEPRGPPSPRRISPPAPTMGEGPRPPGPNAVRCRMEEASHLLEGRAVGYQEQRMGAPSPSWIGIAFHQTAEGMAVTSVFALRIPPVQNFCVSA